MNAAGDNNDDVKQVEIKARKDVLDAIDLECSFWRDKATFKLKWLKKGDKSSRPFHIFAKSKEARDRICLLKIWEFYTDKKEAIAGHIIDFYDSLHCSNSQGRDMSVCPLNQLPTDDIVQIRGISTISVCSLCDTFYCSDSVDHLFASCSFASHLWQWVAAWSRTYLSWTLAILWEDIIAKSLCPQLKNLWLVACFHPFYSICKTRITH